MKVAKLKLVNSGSEREKLSEDEDKYRVTLSDGNGRMPNCSELNEQLYSGVAQISSLSLVAEIGISGRFLRLRQPHAHVTWARSL